MFEANQKNNLRGGGTVTSCKQRLMLKQQPNRCCNNIFISIRWEFLIKIMKEQV